MIAYFKVDGPIGSWHEYVFDISDYAVKEIYVAANYYILHGGIGGYDSDNLWVDHFCIAEPILVSVEEETPLPREFALEQNYPNPFNPSTKISWQSPIGSWQTLKVYDVLGNEVATLVDEEKPAGTYNVEFTIDNLQLSSGVYFYQLKAGSFVETKKMILIK
ncbi:MAG: T9SS type A sorting domain-containing protein [Ignavibacteriales bacterium]|nr:T9SS type A sorting domain-containing protein [Ignavibacteriales bacterium]